MILQAAMLTPSYSHGLRLTADVGVDGPTSRMITMSFVALYDSTEGTNLKITRPS